MATGLVLVCVHADNAIQLKRNKTEDKAVLEQHACGVCGGMIT